MLLISLPFGNLMTDLNTVVMQSISLSVSMVAGLAMQVLTLTSPPPGRPPDSSPALSAFSRASWARIS